MKKEYIRELFDKFENACYDYEGIECWSARELQIILGYSKWDNFKNVIEKAKKSCEKAGELTKNHFADIGKMVEIGSGVEKEIEKLEQKKTEISDKFNDVSLSPELIAKYSKELSELSNQIEEKEMRWMELVEKAG